MAYVRTPEIKYLNEIFDFSSGQFNKTLTNYYPSHNNLHYNGDTYYNMYIYRRRAALNILIKSCREIKNWRFMPIIFVDGNRFYIILNFQ